MRMQVRRELDLPGRPLEARGEQVDEPRRGEDAEDGHDQQCDGKQRPDPPDEIARRLVAALALVLGEDRNERLRERAFGEHAAQDVRQPERRLERVHLHARAEQHGLQAFAHEAGDARQQRHAADGGQRLQQVHEGTPPVSCGRRWSEPMGRSRAGAIGARHPAREQASACPINDFRL